MKQIRIPAGMRDTIQKDAARKEKLRRKIEEVYASYGYEKVETPLIEFYSTYQYAFSSITEEELVKFIDENGNIVALRTDMTLPIARVCASKFLNTEPPYRFRYTANVYKVRQHFAGKRNEVTDCGIELIGMEDTADLEILACALEVMKQMNVEDYTLEIGYSDFFKKACALSSLNEKQTSQLANLVDRKSLVELASYLDEQSLPEAQKKFFLALPYLSGKDALSNAKECSFHRELKEAVEKMETLQEELNELGYGEYVQFDFGKVPHLDYYTGIIFEGYVSGVGSSVLSGGRYDNLLAKFGRDLPACGFGVKIDYLLDVAQEEVETPVSIFYPKDKKVEALKRAEQLRKEGKAVKLVLKDQEEIEVRP